MEISQSFVEMVFERVDRFLDLYDRWVTAEEYCAYVEEEFPEDPEEEKIADGEAEKAAVEELS